MQEMPFDIVTGGAGFVGSHLVETLLANRLRVKVVDNLSSGRAENLQALREDPNLEFVNLDITDLDRLTAEFAGARFIYHLAALADIVPSIQQPDAYFRSNVDGTFSVLEAARAAGAKKIVYAASSSCYGLATDFPTSEAASIDTRYPYALTKYLAEQMVLHWSQVYQIPAVSLRLFNVFGPRSRTSGTYGAVFGVFLAQILAGKPLTIVGDGNQTRDFTYVKDVVRAFIVAADSSVERAVFNVGTGQPQSINRLAELLGATDVTYIPKRPGEPDCTHADIAAIREHLGWQPETSFETGVKHMLEHINYWDSAPVWTPSTIADATQDWFKYLSD